MAPPFCVVLRALEWITRSIPACTFDGTEFAEQPSNPFAGPKGEGLAVRDQAVERRAARGHREADAAEAEARADAGRGERVARVAPAAAVEVAVGGRGVAAAAAGVEALGHAAEAAGAERGRR